MAIHAAGNVRDISLWGLLNFARSQNAIRRYLQNHWILKSIL